MAQLMQLDAFKNTTYIYNMQGFVEHINFSSIWLVKPNLQLFMF